MFPGSSGHVDFTDATSPAATLYSGQSSGAAMHVNGGCADPMSANLFTPLPNDSFATAIGLTGTRGTVTGGNNGASKEAGEPAVAANAGGASVWYRFRAPATGTLRLSTEGSTFNTLLGVYRGTSVAALQEVASNDDVEPDDRLEPRRRPRSSAASPTASPSTGRTSAPARARAWRRSATATGPPTTGSRRRPSCPARRARRSAPTPAPVARRKEPRKIAGKKAGQSVWYVYKSKRAGRLTIDLSGSKFNTVLGVYTGKKITKLHKVAANDNAGKGRSSRLSFRVAKGTKYRILVAGVKTAEGKFILRWRALPAAIRDGTEA